MGLPKSIERIRPIEPPVEILKLLTQSSIDRLLPREMVIRRYLSRLCNSGFKKQRRVRSSPCRVLPSPSAIGLGRLGDEASSFRPESKDMRGDEVIFPN